MFGRILIANRGEIACRVILAARRLGIGTVAVYSDPDRPARLVALAAAAARPGPAPAADSYLNGEAIIAAALATGAEAIHPGYGFLSENPDFVEAVTAAGLTFIGPPAAAIRAMGLKDAAKALMASAGVPVVPGYQGAEQDPRLLAARAAAIGYPVLVKAVAGGGGKGMRRVETAESFAAALEAARGEARSAFGDDRVLIEKFIPNARHIEIQVFGDTLGEIVHLFERDCSLQRRHQKVIEEAPAPGMSEETRAAMGRAAVTAARAIGYVGAGTIEFIVEGSGPPRPDGFWFMEMNTRLQVEHPVTEAITGVDLVEWQIRVAAGEPLPLRQDQLRVDGHAFEARLYAEDPARGFLPSAGLLTEARFPLSARIETGARPGDRISPWYDPMIAKIVTHGPTRVIALARLAAALAETRVAGCATNLGFLSRLARDADFAVGGVDTGLIDRRLADLTAARPMSDAALAAAALASLDPARDDPLAGFALWAPLVHVARLEVGGAILTASVATLGPREFLVDGRRITVTDWSGDEITLSEAGVSRRIGVHRAGDVLTVFEGGEVWVARLPDPLAVLGAVAGGDEIRAPMPGIVKRLPARPGEAVAAGEVLVVLEAMKMEHALTSPREGIIAAVPVAAGAQVPDGALLVRLEPE